MEEFGDGDTLNYCLRKKIERSGMAFDDDSVATGCVDKVHHHRHDHHRHCHVCKECGKGFQSLKALCGHMACHSDKEKPANRPKYDSRVSNKQQRFFVDTECSETADSGQVQACRRSERVRCMNGAVKFVDEFPFVSGVMQVEEVAKCLMMMANDKRVAGCWGRPADFSGSVSGESDDKLPSSSGGFSASPKCSNDDSFEPKHKKSKHGYPLETPEKVMAAATEEDATVVRERKCNAKKPNNRHECPICFRVFKSGQAMGGHKRSHFLGGIDGSSVVMEKEIPKVHPLIDLNFPAFLEGGDGVGDDGLLPW